MPQVQGCRPAASGAAAGPAGVPALQRLRDAAEPVRAASGHGPQKRWSTRGL